MKIALIILVCMLIAPFSLAGIWFLCFLRTSTALKKEAKRLDKLRNGIWNEAVETTEEDTYSMGASLHHEYPVDEDDTPPMPLR